MSHSLSLRFIVLNTMGNLIAGGMVSLGSEMEAAGRDSTKIKESYDAVRDLRPTSQTVPLYADRTNDTPLVDLLDFPLRHASRSVKTSKHLFDVVGEFEGDFDIGNVKSIMKENDYAKLPVPLCPKAPLSVGYTMDLVLRQQPTKEGEPKKWFIAKWYQFVDKMKVCVLLDEVVQGEGFFPIWAHADAFATKKVLSNLLEKLAGHEWSHTL